MAFRPLILSLSLSFVFPGRGGQCEVWAGAGVWQCNGRASGGRVTV